MKTIKFILTAVASVTISTLFVCAQPQRPPFPGNHEERPVRPSATPKERAEKRTDEMDKVVRLDEKQYKKIYKIYLKEEKAKETAMGNGGPMGPPPGGFPGGPGMGGGFPGGFPGAGGFPGGSEMGEGFPGGMPEGQWEPQKPAVGGKEIDSDEYIDAREKKFRKILSQEQYARWRAHCPDPAGFFTR